VLEETCDPVAEILVTWVASLSNWG